MRLLLLVSVFLSSVAAFGADRQINQISVEQSDSDTIIRLYGSGLIRSQKDRLFFAAEASSYSLEPMMMYGDEDYVEVALAMKVAAGQYRISIGPNENTATLESMVVIGAIGPRGEQGPEGEQGPQGEIGPRGEQGPKGEQGPQGETGPAGADGADGAQGLQGPIGPSGPTGPAGPQGAQGATGEQGPVGAVGPKGDAGQSAYTLWLSLGNDGTEDDFLASLRYSSKPRNYLPSDVCVGPMKAPENFDQTYSFADVYPEAFSNGEDISSCYLLGEVFVGAQLLGTAPESCEASYARASTARGPAYPGPDSTWDSFMSKIRYGTYSGERYLTLKNRPGTLVLTCF